MSELLDISIEKPEVGGSPTDNTMMHGVTEKAAGTVDEVDTREENDDNEESDDF